MVFTLVQALQETRSLSEDHGDDPAWLALREQIDAVLARLTEEDSGDPIAPDRAGRLVRTGVDEEEAELAAAALMAVHDRPQEEQLELARAAVEELADALP